MAYMMEFPSNQSGYCILKLSSFKGSPTQSACVETTVYKPVSLGICHTDKGTVGQFSKAEKGQNRPQQRTCQCWVQGQCTAKTVVPWLVPGPGSLPNGTPGPFLGRVNLSSLGEIFPKQVDGPCNNKTSVLSRFSFNLFNLVQSSTVAGQQSKCRMASTVRELKMIILHCILFLYIPQYRTFSCSV